MTAAVGTVLDVSVLVRPGMHVYEGDPEITLERVLADADGAPARALLRQTRREADA